MAKKRERGLNFSQKPKQKKQREYRLLTKSSWRGFKKNGIWGAWELEDICIIMAALYICMAKTKWTL